MNTIDDRPDRLLHALATLPRVESGSTHRDRVRAACRAQLARRRARAAAGPLVQAFVGTFCAIYAWHLARLVFLLP